MALLTNLSAALRNAIATLFPKAAGRELAQIVEEMKALGAQIVVDGDNTKVTFSGTLIGTTQVRGNTFTTDVAGTATEPYTTISDTTISVYGDATNFIEISCGASSSIIDFEGATGQCKIVCPDNLTDALSFAIAAGNNLITLRSTNSDETVFICPAASQQLAFFDAAGAAQQAHVADPSGGATQDAEARTAIVAIIDALKAYGLLAVDP